MESQERIAAKVRHARDVEEILMRIGWSVAALGIAGMAVFSVLWVIGELNVEQGVSLILGTALATILSGATAYGSGVNVGLGAERLELAARDAAGGAGAPVSAGVSGDSAAGMPGSGFDHHARDDAGDAGQR